MIKEVSVEPEKTTPGTGKPGRSEINKAMGLLNKEAARLVGIIDELEKRLLPVLKPQPGTSDPVPKGTVVEEVAPLTETIKEERITINAQILKIGSILQRLGV